MKRLIFSFMVMVAALNLLGARVQVDVSGIKNSEDATISIASYSYLETLKVSADGSYAFENVPDGVHHVKIEAKGYLSSPAKEVSVENGVVSPAVAIKLAVTKQTENPDEWFFKWEEDGSPSGYTQTANVNRPAEIEFLGKKIVPSDVPFYTILEKDYHIYLDDSDEPWTQEYAYRLVETLKTLPVDYLSRPHAVFRLTSASLENDISITTSGEGYEVSISKDAFYYANPFFVSLDGERGKLFSKRLHHALTNFVTDFGENEFQAYIILERRFGCKILNVDYEALTAGITNETSDHFQQFFPSELVAIINMFEEMPEGFHVTPHLNYLIRRKNGMRHPLYPEAAAVAWPVDNGYIEFMESAFGSNNETFETQRLILHEKSHFLWQFVFSDEIKNDWAETGGWYVDPNGSDGWSTTKDVEFVSAYAHAHNPNEDMAESIAFYLKNPDKLLSRSPEKYEFICNRIMHGTRYISKIPDHLTFEVLNLYPDYDYPGKIKRVNVTCQGAPDEDKLVTVEIELNDVEGFDDSASHAFVRLTSPTFECEDGSYDSQYEDLHMSPIDETGHILQGTIIISKYSKTGHWTAGDIIVSDMVGNQRFEGQNDCVFDLYVNNSLEDLVPPVYEGVMRYILTDIDLDGHEAQNLQMRFKVHDNIGFKSMMCRVQTPGNNYSVDVYGVYEVETGEAVINIPITEFYPTGNYYVSNLILTDKAGNSRWFDFYENNGKYPTEYCFIETPNPDTKHPEIDLQRITVYAEPTHPEAPDGETIVTISFYGRDDKSGLGLCNYRLRDPQGIDHFEYFYHRNFGTLYFDGDPTVWEHYLIKVVLPQGSAPGIWGLSEMTVVDKALNPFTYNFVETLIFEPDNNESDYELFADVVDESLIFGVASLAESQFSYKWRIIHEQSGLEINGESGQSVMPQMARAASRQQISADISSLPKGDLILIVEVSGEDGNVESVKTKRIANDPKLILAESLTLNHDSWHGKVGENLQLTATVIPDDVTDKEIVWSSSDESVATVDEEGLVLILKNGTCTITASTVDGSDLSASCTVTADAIQTGIDALFSDETSTVDVISLEGILLMKDCTKDALNSLAPGVYIIQQGSISQKITIK